jgi:2-dehydro-3-deoxyphosphogluconate aldolase/(4S)-4-hydroxy-2-oxoglutarate aldolase
MSAHDRLQVLNTILEQGLVPTIQVEASRDADELATSVAVSIADGGARVVEFLNRGDGALDVFAAIAKGLRRERPDVALGIGSIVDAPTAALAIAHGASFVVGPNLNGDVARVCNRRKVAYLPGCATVSEISNAEELGCEIVKLFPSSAMNGPEFVRSLRGPMPWSRVMPTGNGVAFREDSIRDWFAAGACAVGMGASLVERSLVEARNFAELSRRTARALQWIATARGR